MLYSVIQSRWSSGSERMVQYWVLVMSSLGLNYQHSCPSTLVPGGMVACPFSDNKRLRHRTKRSYVKTFCHGHVFVPNPLLIMAATTETVSLSYVQAPETSESLDWADLMTLDLSKFDQPGGKQELAAEFTRAIDEVGMC